MFQLHYNLSGHGWATASIMSDEASLTMDVSYLSDGLGDFARAARGLLRGLPETTFRFQQEPGEHRVVLARQDDSVVVSVFRFPTEFSKLQHEELVLTATCTVREFATASINCLRRVLDEHGEEGYLQRWKNFAFPLQEYRDLLDLRRDQKDAGQSTRQ